MTSGEYAQEGWALHQRIAIATPYFVPDETLMRALFLALQQGFIERDTYRVGAAPAGRRSVRKADRT